MRLVFIALSWTMGIVLAANNTSQLPAIWLGLVALSCVVLGLWWRTGRMAAITLLAFTLGGLRFSLIPDTSALAAYNNTGGLTVEGIVTDAPDVRDNGVLLRVSAETLTRAGTTLPTNGLVLVRAPTVTTAQYGDRVRATGLLISPAEFDTFSYADYLARSGVYSILTRSSVEVLAPMQGNPLQIALFNWRQQASTNINAALPEPAAGLLNGILLGNEQSIAPELRDAFAVTGAAHLLAISGFNMVVLAGTVQKLFGRSRRGVAALAAIGAIFLYTALVGATPAVLRAALMSALLVIGQGLRRKTFVPTSLAFAVLLLSLLNPTTLWDIGFQLSFFATLGLAMFATPITERIARLIASVSPPALTRLLVDNLSETLGVSLAAMITALPLTTLYFGQLSVVTLIVNLLVVPIQPALLIIGGLATLTAPFLFVVAQALYWLDLVLLSWTSSVVRLFGRLPGAQIEFTVDPRLVLIFFIGLIGWGMVQAQQPEWLGRLARFIRSRLVQVSTLLAGLCIVVLTFAVASSRPDGFLHVWLLDVGGYNAVLAQTPGGTQFLVDGGSFPSQLLTAIGDRMPFNDRDIEVVAITQPDEANFNALTAVLERYHAGVVLTNGQPNLGSAWQALEGAAGSTERLAVSAGYVLESSDGARLEVLHPQNAPAVEDSLNDGTMVLRLTYGGVSFLLTSDLSSAGQEMLLESNQAPIASILQVPQGGTSLHEAFLTSVQPQVIMLQNNSASSRNNDDVLALLPDIPLFRTDQDGTIHLWTDGEQLWVVKERA